MSRLFQNTHDTDADVLAALAAAVYFLGFFGAVHAALGKLITLNRKVQAVRGKLVLCNISKEIREVFEITKLDKLFTILPDEQAALQAF